MNYFTTSLGVIVITIIYIMHWKACIASQTILYHRGAAHDMYTFKSEFWKKICYIISFLFLGPSYLSTKAYAIMHRMHHAYADTDKDPHRPYDGFWGVFKTMWLTARRYNAIYKEARFIEIDGSLVEIEGKFKKNIMEWSDFDKIFHTWPVRILWIILYIYLYSLIINFFNLSPLFYGMVILHSIMAPLHGAIVNYYAHKYGDAPNNVNNTSKNLPREARILLMLMGELWHNNHHAQPSNPDFSLGKFGEVDTGFKLLQFLERENVLEIKKQKLPMAA